MATEINIKNLPEGYQSIISNGRHSIIGDEPIPSKGTDLGMSPTELVLAGLALCKVATVRYVARNKGWDVRDVKAQLSQTVGKGEGRQLHTDVQISIQIEGDLTEAQRKELLEKADRCYVHRMLDGTWDIGKAQGEGQETADEA